MEIQHKITISNESSYNFCYFVANSNNINQSDFATFHYVLLKLSCSMHNENFEIFTLINFKLLF